MKITPVSNQIPVIIDQKIKNNAALEASQKQPPQQKVADKIDPKSVGPAVAYEPSKETQAAKEVAPKVSPEEQKKIEHQRVMQFLKAETDKNYETLKMLVRTIFKDQGNEFVKAIGGKLNIEGQKIEIPESVQLEAKAAIAEDGPMGVKATAGRIVDFAIAAAGGNKEKLAEIKAAVEKGFKDAEKIWGGKLPEISQNTYDEVMKRLDAWANPESEKPVEEPAPQTLDVKKAQSAPAELGRIK